MRAAPPFVLRRRAPHLSYRSSRVSRRATNVRRVTLPATSRAGCWGVWAGLLGRLLDTTGVDMANPDHQNIALISIFHAADVSNPAKARARTDGSHHDRLP